MTIPAGYVPGFVCTLNTCSVKLWGYVHYQPTIIGNVLFLIIIDLLALSQLILGIKYRTGLVCFSMLLGLASESMGYIARILMHYDPFSRVYFLWYLICLTIGPVFMTAAIYLCLGRVVIIYGENISRIKPRSYTLFFMGIDIISLLVQTAGGAIAASVSVVDQKMINLGTHILVAGLSFQVASLFGFSVCSAEYLIRAKRHSSERNLDHADLYNSKKFKHFLVSTMIATACLFIRTVFRSVELSEGFTGHLANNEIEFMILDGVMVISACICLTVMHPGIGFGKEKWAAARFPFWGPKQHSSYTEREIGGEISNETEIPINETAEEKYRA